MSLKSSNKVETNRYELEIEVDAQTFENALEAAYKKEVKKIQVQGFRKGKAPRKIVEKMYGDNVFFEDAINALYPESLESAVKEAGLEMIEDKIDFDLVNASKEEGLTFKVKITTKPEVEISAYKGLEVTKANTEVTDEDVNKEVEALRQRNSRTVEVTDRAAQNDDIANIDFEGFVDGVAFDGGKGEGYDLTLGSGQFIPGFEEQIVGKTIGEEFDVNVKFPEDYNAEELKGKDSVFKCKLNKLSVRELPEANDDLITDSTEFDSLDSFKADAKEKLAKSKEKAATDDVDNKLIDKLIENMTAEIPEAMYTSRMNGNLQEFEYRLQSQGLTMDNYLKYTGMTTDSIKESMRPQAQRQVKLRLALEKIADLEAIAIADEDVDAELQKMADQYQMTLEQIKSFVPVDEMKTDMAVEKAMGLVRDNAQIATEV